MPRGTTIRAIRVSDRVWDKAQRIAEFNDTTVSTILVGYLKGLNINSKLRPSQIRQGGPSPIERNLAKKRRDYPDDASRARTATPTVPTIKPEDCEHPGAVTVSFGTFCTTCQKRIA